MEYVNRLPEFGTVAKLSFRKLQDGLKLIQVFRGHSFVIPKLELLSRANELSIFKQFFDSINKCKNEWTQFNISSRERATLEIKLHNSYLDEIFDFLHAFCCFFGGLDTEISVGNLMN